MSGTLSEVARLTCWPKGAVPYVYRAEVIRVIDGDTLEVQVDLGFKIFSRQVLRLAKLNCPEINTPGGLAAKGFTAAWVDDCSGQVVVQTMKDKREKYGRMLAVVTHEDRELNAELILNGHAK